MRTTTTAPQPMLAQRPELLLLAPPGVEDGGAPPVSPAIAPVLGSTPSPAASFGSGDRSAFDGLWSCSSTVAFYLRPACPATNGRRDGE
jgi:hypothetical protein